MMYFQHAHSGDADRSAAECAQGGAYLRLAAGHSSAEKSLSPTVQLHQSLPSTTAEDAGGGVADDFGTVY